MRQTKAGGVPRDAFFEIALLLLVTTGFVAVLWTGRLDQPTALAAGAALVARALIIRGWLRAPLSERMVRVLTIGYIGFYPLDFLYLSQDFLGATVRLVFFLAAIKLLTAQSPRDYLYLGLIALLELLAAAMLTSSPGILVFLALFLMLAIAARMRYEIVAGGGRAAYRAPAGSINRKLAGLSVVLAAGISLFGLGLFFLVPRAAVAYLSRLPATGESMVGFSEEINLGTSGRITPDSTPALRVRVLEGQLGPDVKWRGGALQHFDGVKWTNPPTAAAQVLESTHGHYFLSRQTSWGGGWRVRYRVIREPMDSDALFLPGTAEAVGGDFTRLEVSDTDGLGVPGSRGRSLRYEGVSSLEPARPAELGGLGGPYPVSIRSAYLQLPELDPRIRQLARYITDSQVTPYWRAAALEHYLRTEFSYALELPPEAPADPLADFLFHRKRGHCEYFASAMAVMLRSLGIPARVANGFQSGVYNRVSGYYTVRASEAHAWVEAYFPGFGWATFDPTPPEPLAAPPGRSWLYLDALEAFWNDWIVEYDLARQLGLARSVQMQWYRAGYETAEAWDRGWFWAEEQWRSWKRQPVRLAWGALAALAAAGAGFLAPWLWPRLRAAAAARRVARGRGGLEDCALLYNRAVASLKRLGFVRPSWQTPEEFAATLGPPRCSDHRAALLRQITAAYNHARFAGDREAGRQLAELVRTATALRR